MTWTTALLGDVATLDLGKMLDQHKNKGELRPYLANINVRWGQFDLNGLREMRFESDELDRFSLRRGDIVMCEGGEPGRCAIWKEDAAGMMFQKALHRIRPSTLVDSCFLFYAFLHFGKSGGFSQYFTGSTIKHLTREQLAKVVIRFPEFKTQQSIAEILVRYDDLIENNRRRIALLEESARLLYREWFVHLRFPGAGPVSPTTGLPDGWRRAPLEDALFLQRGFDLPNGSRVPDGVPVYASSGVAGFHNTAKAVGPGLVTGRSGTLGVVHYVDQDYWPLNTALWVKEFRAVTPAFAYFLLAEMDLAQLNSGSTVPTLDRKVAHAQPVIIPSTDAVAEFEDRAGGVFRQIKVLEKLNVTATEARDALLPKLMSGEIAV